METAPPPPIVGELPLTANYLPYSYVESGLVAWETVFWQERQAALARQAAEDLRTMWLRRQRIERTLLKKE